MSRYNHDDPNHGLHVFVAFVGSFPAEKISEEFPYVQLENCIDRFKQGPIKRKVKVILDGHTEGIGWKHVEGIASHLTSNKGLSHSDIVLWSGSREWDAPIPMVQNLSALALVTDHTKVRVMDEPTHHFVMLARVPRLHRILAAVELIERNLLQYGYASCGSGNYGPLDHSVFDVVPDRYRHMFPMGIDGIHVGTKESKDSGMLPEAAGAFCQLIPESSHDMLSYGWNDPFPTEKTTKCMLMHQVPIWVTSPLHVENMRQLGFDVFDDLVDHSYDTEKDPIKRISMAVDQLQRICEIPLADLIRYRIANQERFSHNRSHCIVLRETFMDMHYEKFKTVLGTVK